MTSLEILSTALTKRSVTSESLARESGSTVPTVNEQQEAREAPIAIALERTDRAH